MLPKLRPVLGILLSLVVAFVASCSGPRQPPSFTIKGKVTRSGQPLKVSENGLLVVQFISVTDPNLVYPADTDTGDGSYKVAGLPVGKYRVAVQQFDPHPGKDLLGDGYSPEKTTLEYEVTSDQDWDIKLPR